MDEEITTAFSIRAIRGRKGIKGTLLAVRMSDRALLKSKIGMIRGVRWRVPGDDACLFPSGGHDAPPIDDT